METQRYSTNVHRSIKSKRISLPLNTDLWSKLDDATLESILARLPFIDLFRCQLVTKNWDSIIHSSTFQKAYQELTNRLPWFFMLNTDAHFNVVYDVEVNEWRQCQFPLSVSNEFIQPLTSSYSLMCGMTGRGDLIVCNPLTGSRRVIAQDFSSDDCTEAITLRTTRSKYKVYVILSPTAHSLTMKIYSSEDNTWTEFPLKEENVVSDEIDQDDDNLNEDERFPNEGVDNEEIDFSCSTKLAGVSTIDSNGREMVYYLFRMERLIGCDIHRGIAYRYPLLPGKMEDASDVVECRGRILVVVKDTDSNGKTRIQLSEFDHDAKIWKAVSTIPYDMSEKYSGKIIEVDCSGCDDCVMICVFSVKNNIFNVLMYNIVEDVWVELPPYFKHHTGHRQNFVTPFAIMPDTKATA